MNRLHISLIVLSAFLLQGCLKNNTPPSAIPQYTYISVYQLSPLADTVDIFINNSIASSNLPYGTMFPAYSGIEPGEMTVRFTPRSKDSSLATIPLHNYDTLQFYTWILYNQVAGDGVEAMKIKDDFSPLTNEKAYCRFFHFSPSAGAVDIYFDNVAVALNKQNGDIIGMEEFTKFKPFTPGETAIKVKAAGSENELASGVYNLGAGGAYTVIFRGSNEDSGDNALKLSVIQAMN